MFPQKQTTTTSAQKLAKHHIYRNILWGMLFVFLILCMVTYLSKKTVQLSYSSHETCTKQILFLPESYKSPAADKGFAIRHTDLFKVSDTTLFSFKTCFRPTKLLKPGSAELSIAPDSGLLASKTFKIDVPEPPKASVQLLSGPVSTIRPLQIKLSDTDGLNDYLIHADQKISKCVKIDSAISCDMKSLNLAQDKDYPIKITRSFNGGEPETVATKTVHTLQATNIVQAAIVNQQVIYDSPTSFNFKFDRPIEDQKVSLTKTDDNTTVAITNTTKGDTLKITLAKPLDREANFELRLDDVIAVDGSTLGQPYVARFKTSGGPTVSNVSVGSYGLPLAQTITIDLDQPVSSNVTKLVSVSGVAASISATKQQIKVSYTGAMPCTVINISIAAGLKSVYGTVQNRPWSFQTRTTCRRTTKVIGSSVRGRPIYAYYYGTGATTVLFTGGIHGNERSGSYIMKDWVNYLDGNAYKIPANKQIVVVPEINPDGLASYTRNNAHNVNLDRNFPAANWKANIDTSSGILVGGGGSSALSEPEAKALADLTTSLRPRLEVSFHAQGSLIGANQFGDSSVIGNLYGSLVGYRSMIGQAEQTMGYSITGEYEDWMGEKYSTPAILIELPTLSGRYFTAHQQALWRMVNI